MMIEFRILWNDNMDRQQTANELIMDGIKLRLSLEVDGTNVVKLSNIQKIC